MRVLDLDLDFFLEGVTWKYGVGDRFPDEESHPPWSSERVEKFLEDQCGLCKESPVPGRVVTTHDEVLWDWLKLPESGQSWTIVHVDAHGDLGYNESCLIDVLTSFLNLPFDQRLQNLKEIKSEITQGCYLLYALACRRIGKLTYVHHPNGGDDVPDQILKNFDTESQRIELKSFDVEMGEPLTEEAPIDHREPSIPFELISGPEYQNSETYDYMYLSKSPAYTPPSADSLIEVIEQYMEDPQYA